jgi:YVTN family beta-propeller protein
MQLIDSRILHHGIRCAAVLAVASLAAPAFGADLAYVGNQGDGTVSVIDTTTDAVIRTLPAHGKIGEKIQAVLTNRAQTRSFVVDAAGNSLVVVDDKSGRIGARLHVGKAPEGASLSPSGKTIAVCVEDDNLVTLVDVARAKVLRKIPTQGKNPEHCVFSADERWLMTSDENSNNVDVIDLAAGRSVALVPTTGKPRGIAWLAGRPIAYVAQENGGGVDVVDVERRAMVQSIKTGLRPADAIASADGARVFVSNGGDGTISVIDTATQKVIATIPVGKRPWNMALTADGKKLYVANGRSHSVSVIDTGSLALIKEIGVGELPWGVSIP